MTKRKSLSYLRRLDFSNVASTVIQNVSDDALVRVGDISEQKDMKVPYELICPVSE